MVGDTGWVAGPLMHRQQTVYRTELFALLWALEHHVGYRLTVVSDCQGVVEEANRLAQGGGVRPGASGNGKGARL